MSNPEITRVMQRLENRFKPKHANLRKPHNTIDLTELLKQGPIRRIQHVLNRERKRKITYPNKNRVLNIPTEKDKNIKKIFVRRGNQIFALSLFQEKPGQKVKMFSDEDLLKKVRRRKEKKSGPMESVSNSLISIDYFVESPEKYKDLDDILKQKIIMIDNQGNIIINKTKANSIIGALLKDKEPELERKATSQLISIFGKENPEDIVTAALITQLSSKKGLPNVSWLTIHKGKDYYRTVKKIVKAFQQSLNEIYKEISSPQYLKNSLIYKLNSMLRKGDIDFTEINKHLLSIIYRHYYPFKATPNDKALNNFSYLPGISEAILTLRKLFLASLNRTFMPKSQRFLIGHSSDVINGESLEELYGNKEGINLLKLRNFESDELVKHLAYLVIEGKIANNRKYFLERKVLITKNNISKLTINDFLFPQANPRIIKRNKVEIPITTTIEGSLSTFPDIFLNIYFGETLISLVNIPKQFEIE